jgi:hypothetical protein
MLMAGWLSATVQAEVALKGFSSEEVSLEPIAQVIVQIGGRFCEYHRHEVEEALRRYPSVQMVDFLNDHGTILVRYRAEGILPAQLAESAARAAFGMGCTAWVDRGGSPQAKS